MTPEKLIFDSVYQAAMIRGADNAAASVAANQARNKYTRGDYKKLDELITQHVKLAQKM